MRSILEEDLYRIAASVEQNANHPLAKAIVLAAQENHLKFRPHLSVHSEAGQGISAHIDRIGLVKVGKPAYCELILPDNMSQIWQIASIVAASADNNPIGAFALADSLKEDSLQAIQRLHQHNIDVVIMSGDQQSVVDYVAQQVRWKPHGVIVVHVTKRPMLKHYVSKEKWLQWLVMV